MILLFVQKIHRIHFDTIDSTANWVAAHWANLHSACVTCVTAAVQTAGRGRRTKGWISKRGNLHMTLFYRLQKGDPRLPNLAQILALGVCEVFPTKIKWPNDLIAHRAKLGGILVELIDCGDAVGVAHSIGLNAHTRVEADQPTITLQEWTRKTYDLDALAITLTRALIHQLQQGFSREAFTAKLAYLDETTICRGENGDIVGINRGIDSKGRLLLELENGEMRSISSANLQSSRESP